MTFTSAAERIPKDLPTITTENWPKLHEPEQALVAQLQASFMELILNTLPNSLKFVCALIPATIPTESCIISLKLDGDRVCLCLESEGHSYVVLPLPLSYVDDVALASAHPGLTAEQRQLVVALVKSTLQQILLVISQVRPVKVGCWISDEAGFVLTEAHKVAP